MLEANGGNLDEIRKLYPSLTDEGLRTAQYNLRCYLEVVVRISERLDLEGKDLPES